MTTQQHLQKLIAEYYEISGLLARAVVELVTSDNDEQAHMHANAIVRLSEGCNTALDNLRRYCSGPGVLGRDNWFEFLEKPDLQGEVEQILGEPDA